MVADLSLEVFSTRFSMHAFQKATTCGGITMKQKKRFKSESEFALQIDKPMTRSQDSNNAQCLFMNRGRACGN